MPRQETDMTKEGIAAAMQYAGQLILCLASAVLICQTYVWVRNGSWPSLSIADTWRVFFKTPFPETGWGGIGSAAVWLSGQADSVVLIIVGLGLKIAGSMLRR
jgi:hypothetical protein